jgi:VWFA-related protein
MHHHRVLMFLILATAGSDARAQTTTTIQAETKLVLVDVAVTDKKGDYVLGLTAKDFRLWVDNREQAISNFSPPAGIEAQAASRKHYLVLFFDDTTMGERDRARVRQAAAQLIGANAGPNSLIALVNFSGTVQLVQNFTGDANRLNEAINALSLSSLRPAAVTEGTFAAPSAATTFGNRSLVLELGRLAGNMRTIPARKSLLLFTGGFAASTALMPELSAAVEICNRADVAIYPVDLRGLEGVGTPDGSRRVRNKTDVAANAPALSSPVDDSFSAARPPWAAVTTSQYSENHMLTNRQIMDLLAEGSGGFVVTNASDPLAGLAKIIREQNDSYVLGYVPAAEGEEKSCHALRVKVVRTGLTVRSRNTYCNAPPADSLAGKPIEKELETRINGSQPGTWSASVLTPYFYTAPDLARVDLAMEIDPAPLPFEKQKGRIHAAVNIIGMAYAADGSVITRFSDTLDLHLVDEKEIEALHRKGLHYESQFEIAPGTYNLKVAFTSAGEAFGKLEMPLVIEPHHDSQFSLSSLALSREVRRTSQSGAEIEASLLQDRTPLIANDLQVVPSGSNVFRQGEPSMFYFEVYEPRLAHPDPKQPTLVGIQIRVLDRQTAAPKHDSGVMRLDVPTNPGDPVIPAALKVPIQGLAPGLYILELTAADTADQLARRTADFEIR